MEANFRRITPSRHTQKNGNHRMTELHLWRMRRVGEGENGNISCAKFGAPSFLSIYVGLGLPQRDSDIQMLE